MVSIAKENLFHEKSKTIMSIGGVILSVFLVFTINGVYNGMDYVMDSMVTKTGADIWITQEGTSGSVHSPSLVNYSVIEPILLTIDGIEEFTPLIRTAINYNASGGNILLFINGYNTSGTIGGPWNIVEGKAVPGSKEIIIDYVFAAKNNFKVGQNITLISTEFTIVGLSDETNLMIGFFVFLTYKDANPYILGNPTTQANSVLIKVDTSKASISDIKTDIENALPNFEVVESSVVAAGYKNEILGSFEPILAVMSLIALFVGTLIIALLIYMITIEKSKEYGIIKAMGATNLHLYKIVLEQALLISVIGYVAGVVISIPLISLMRNVVPEFLVIINLEMVFSGFFLFLLAGIFASFIPVKRLASIDPAQVFKA